MQYLPISSLREEDGPIVGRELLNLAKLDHLDFPVTSGIAVFPPHLKFENILKHLEHQAKEIFEQQLTIIKKEVSATICPADLARELNNKKIDPKKAWQTLLEVWLEQIKSQVYREGIVKDISKNLIAEPVFFTAKVSASAQSFDDPNFKETIIKIKFGNLSKEQIDKIKDYTKEANKKLVIHQVFDWVVDGQLKLIKLKPFTQVGEVQDAVVLKSEELTYTPKPAVKIFLNLGNSFVVKGDLDGVLIQADLTDQAVDKQTRIDKKMLQFVEAAITLKEKFAIFKLSDKVDSQGGVRGSLRLIHDSELLKEEAEVFLFARNKKGLLNAHIAVPFVRSSEEFLQMKRELAGLGINRKGSLKMWLEVAIPENIINIQSYIEAGFDGVLLNLDELASWVGGFDPKVAESVFYKKQLTAVLELVKTILKPLHLAEIPILACGASCLETDVTKFLLENGVWGIVGDYMNILGLEEHLMEMEKRILRAKQ